MSITDWNNDFVKMCCGTAATTGNKNLRCVYPRQQAFAQSGVQGGAWSVWMKSKESFQRDWFYRCLDVTDDERTLLHSKVLYTEPRANSWMYIGSHNFTKAFVYELGHCDFKPKLTLLVSLFFFLLSKCRAWGVLPKKPTKSPSPNFFAKNFELGVFFPPGTLTHFQIPFKTSLVPYCDEDWPGGETNT
jgi:hypothetical protein